jgi:dextranase
MQLSKSKLKVLDFYPESGTYLPGQPVRLILELESTYHPLVKMHMIITRGARVVEDLDRTVELPTGFHRIEWAWQAPQATGGYGAAISLTASADKQDLVGGTIETAFDILPDWTVFPRYGFLCDFSPNRKDISETIQTLAKYHINGLQFYDWQYRHDSLLPAQDEFVDPLGRSLSLKTIRQLLEEAHAHGMAAMPYLAVYAASADFWRSHADWALYDGNGKMIPFGENFLGLMNPAPGSNWQRHLLDECSHVLDSLPFDGLHIDQYGEPKEVYDQHGQAVNLPEAFKNFVQSAVNEHPGRPVLFNAVGNWPIESLAAAPTAFNYIEVWPPDTSYLDLVRIVRNARNLSGGKPVVIALYLPSGRITNIRLADALIHSAGGSRIELGENERLLSDPYFPKHEALSENLRKSLRHSADFVVRYSDWLSPAIPETFEVPVRIPEGIQAFVRQTGQGWSVSLVNMTGLTVSKWDEEHPAPQPMENFIMELDLPEEIEHIWLATPDGDSLLAQPVEFTKAAGIARVKIPRLEFWDILFLETKPQ